jgi:hypothetical protein
MFRLAIQSEFEDPIIAVDADSDNDYDAKTHFAVVYFLKINVVSSGFSAINWGTLNARELSAH